MQKVELPFVVGVLADLSGQPKEALRPLKERKVANIDRDNFNDVLAKAAPRVAMKVDNKLTDEGDTKLAVELNFKNIDDFEPAKVAAQVGPLKELMDMRQRLTQLLSKMEGNDKLEQLLNDVMSNTEKALALAKEMGIESPAGRRRKPSNELTRTQAAGAAAAQTVEAPSLLDQIVQATSPQNEKEADRAKDYFKQFLEGVVKPGQVVSKDVETNIKFWIGEIDKKLSAQLNEVMHHPDFQKLESTWRGLHYLVHQTRDGRDPQDPRHERQASKSCSRTWRRPPSSIRAAVQEDLRGRIRPARRAALRHAGRRLRVRPRTPKTCSC